MEGPNELDRRLRRPKVVVVSALVDLFLRGLDACYRRRLLTPDRLVDLVDMDPPPVLVVWHHQLLMLTTSGPKLLLDAGLRPPAILISRSEDGDFGHRLGLARGTTIVRGSSSRGGAAAVRQLVRQMKVERRPVVVIPDGPRGPSRRVKEGALTLAALAGAPIVPIAFVASSAWRLGSWDRTIVPKPFARVGVAIGHGIQAPRRGNDAERAEQMRVVDRALDDLEAWAQSALE